MALQHALRAVSELGVVQDDKGRQGRYKLLSIQRIAFQSEGEIVSEVLTDGHEFMIGKKIFMLQRNLVDGTWDVEIPIHGWQSTGFPAHATAIEAEAMFKSNYKGGAKKFLARRKGGMPA